MVQPGDSAAGWAPERLVPGGRRAARLEPEPAVMPDFAADPEGEPGPVAGRLWDVTDPASADPIDVGRPAAVEALLDAANAPHGQTRIPAAAGQALAGEAAGGTIDPDLLAALQAVLNQGASDLHLTANAPPMIRVDGGLRPAGRTEPWQRDKVLSALGSLLTDEQRTIFDTELELDFAYTLPDTARFRVNYYQQRGSLGAAFRLIPWEIKQFGELGIPERIGEFAKLPRGLVLVTGPTGSGKSTTLAAMIDLVNRTRADHIVTVEDPIEFLHSHQMSLVNQREVGNDTHSFAAALKHVLRQDPDVILIGELRDLETMSVALTAAETGHLVFATLHTQDAAQTIDRVIDVFPPHQQGQVRSQLAGVLQGVVCQTLVKRASGRGRVVATEVLVATPAIANLIREGKTYQVHSMMQAGRGLGMHTMDQHLAELVGSGQITRAAADEKVHDPETFDRLLERGDSSGAMAERAAGIDFGDSFSSEAG